MPQDIILPTQKMPKLRFPEFNSELREKKLWEIGEFSKGKGISKDEVVADGEVECIRYGELYTKYKESIDVVYSKTNLSRGDLIISKGNEIIIPSSGETHIDIARASCISRSGIAIGGDINILQTQQNGLFLSYYLNGVKKYDIAKLSQGSSVIHLYIKELKGLPVTIPDIIEQRKIASFLSSIDSKIEKLREQKFLFEQYKKGVIQKIFSQEIRFKDENGGIFPEWEEQELGSLLNYEQPTKYLVESQEYNNQYSTPVLTAGKTFILGYTNEETGVFNKGLPVIIFDDFTTATQFVDFPFKAKSSAMKILRAINGNSARFLYEILHSIDFQIGGHGRHWISIFAKMSIVIPSIPEQQKIASFLSEIDAKIKSTSTQIEHAEKWKKGLLQQMFI